VLGLSEAMHNGDDTRISNTGTMNPTSNAASSTAAANKKVNNEQWDAMFERWGRYKEQHGVRKTIWNRSNIEIVMSHILTLVFRMIGLFGTETICRRSQTVRQDIFVDDF